MYTVFFRLFAVCLFIGDISMNKRFDSDQPDIINDCWTMNGHHFLSFLCHLIRHFNLQHKKSGLYNKKQQIYVIPFMVLLSKIEDFIEQSSFFRDKKEKC